MKIIFVNPWTKFLFGDEKQASGYPHLIAISSYSYCYSYAQDLIENIKVRFPLITIIVGGLHISTSKGYILETTKMVVYD